MAVRKWGEKISTGFTPTMKLNDGDNTIRVVSDPTNEFIHWCKTNDGKTKKLTCLGLKECPVCNALGKIKADAIKVIENITGAEFKMDDLPKQAEDAKSVGGNLSQAYDDILFAQSERGLKKNAVYVIDRSDQTIKILEFGATINDGIEALAKDDDFGDPRGYDIKIKKSGRGRDTKYSIVPGKQTPISDEESVNVKSLPLIETLYAPKSVEEVRSYPLMCYGEEIPI